MHAGLWIFTLGHIRDYSRPDFPKYKCLLCFSGDEMELTRLVEDYGIDEKQGYPDYIP